MSKMTETLSEHLGQNIRVVEVVILNNCLLASSIFPVKVPDLNAELTGTLNSTELVLGLDDINLLLYLKL